MNGWKRMAQEPGVPGMPFRRGRVVALVSIDDGRWHLSLSLRDRNPTWKELHDARYDLLPDGVTMAQILPPKREYVNLHAHCFHLWQVGGPAPSEQDIIRLTRRTA